MFQSGLQLNFNFHTSSWGTTPQSSTSIFSLHFNAAGTQRDKLNDTNKEKAFLCSERDTISFPQAN
jgi:hypothetical protein